MRLDSPRFAKVGKYMFTSKAFMSEPDVMKDGTTKRSIIGYHSDRWAIPGGAEWDDMRLRHSESEAQAMIDCQATADMEIGVNIRYLIDAADAIEGGTITIEYEDPKKAIVFVSDSLSVVVAPRIV